MSKQCVTQGRSGAASLTRIHLQANLLISDQHTGKLCDFGLAFLLEDPVFRAFRSELTGTVRWCSPEALHQEAGLEADVWAWGWTVFEVGSEQNLFAHLSLTCN